MSDLVSIVRSEQYTPLTLREWTDGPKYIIDTNGVIDSIDLCDLCTVITAPSEVSVRTVLERFLMNGVATIYFVDDKHMAGLAMQLRPDLDIRLLLL